MLSLKSQLCSAPWDAPWDDVGPIKHLVMVQRCIPWKCFDDTSCFVASRGLSWVECKPRGCREHNPITCNLLPLYRCLSQLTKCVSKNAPFVITYLRSPAQNDSTSFHANQISLNPSVRIGIPMNVPPTPCPAVGEDWLLGRERSQIWAGSKNYQFSVARGK